MIELDKDNFHIVTYGSSKTSREVILFGEKSGVKYYFSRRGSAYSGYAKSAHTPRWIQWVDRGSDLKLEFIGQFRKESVKKFFEERLTRSNAFKADIFRRIFDKKK